MSDNPRLLREQIANLQGLADELARNGVGERQPIRDTEEQIVLAEDATVQLKMVNMDPPDLRDEDKTDEPLFVRVDNTVYTTYSKNKTIKLHAYQAIPHEQKKFDTKGRQMVDDFGSIFIVMGTGTAITRPEMRLSLLINGDPDQQRELTDRLMKEYYERQGRNNETSKTK